MVTAYLFYIFASLLLLSALGVILSQHTVQAALCLVATFFTAAVLWLLLEAEFLAMTLVLVYVGAVMVLFLFVVMMIHVEQVEVSRVTKGHTVLSLALMLSACGLTLFFIGSDAVDSLTAIKPPLPEGYQHAEALAMALFTEHLYAFELAGILLLTAIVAAIALTFRGQQNRKTQCIQTQVQASKAERLTLVKMDPVGVPPA